MRNSAHKHNLAVLCVVIKPVKQQKITSDMTLSMLFSFAVQRVIKPLRPKRGIVCNQ
jgi:hypothetical protein